MSWSNQTKNTSSFSRLAKNVGSWLAQVRPGVITGGWMFNEAQLQFNSVDDPNGNDQVMFNGTGIGQTWATLAKS